MVRKVSIVLILLVVAGCVRVSGGTWYIREAALPDDWPSFTSVGEVEVKTYPDYRAAVIRKTDMPQGETSSMFRKLFNHIKDREISMTAPVEMGYSGDATQDDPQMASMAFLYRTTTQGKTEIDGTVIVQDLPGQSFASIGVRGRYNDENMTEQLPALEAWLSENQSQWQADGPPRYLGYNSPFVLPFMRYGEVQIPLRKMQ